MTGGTARTGETGRARGGFETLAIHAGQDPDPATGAVVPPIYQVSTYAQDGVGNLRAGYEYSRTANPTRTALEECLAALEGGTRALAFASGMAAEDCLLRTICRPGDHVLIPQDAYGGTYRLFDKVLAPWQVSYQPVPVSDPQAVKHALEQRPARAVWVETPTNPLLSIVDISAAGGAVRRRGRAAGGGQHVRLALPAEPAGARRGRGGPLDHQVPGRPLRRGGRRGGGGRRRARRATGLSAERDRRGRRAVRRLADVARHQDARRSGWTGTVKTPCGWRTCWPRIQRSPGCSTRGCPATPVTRSRPSRCAGSAGWCRSGCAAVRRRRSRCAGGPGCSSSAESLGGVESLIEHPGRMTHASAAGSPLEVPADLIRLSVGIESADDLLEDLRSALG